MATTGHQRKRSASDNILPTPLEQHPYLSGNFAPIQRTVPLTPCTYAGSIPEELAGGEYVRNGSNPVSNSDLGRDAHWFDGDGMLSGVSFTRDEQTGDILPEFVNQFILTDLYLSALSSDRLRVPILPSIATLVNPLARVIYVTLRIFRTILLVILSHLPGSKQKIKKISVANTSVIYHDGRAMALCESGPPMRIQLPGLETVGWYNGSSAEGEPKDATSTEKERALGDESGLLQFMREWTTAHPKVDPKTKEMLMFHACFAPPYVQYSILPKQTASGHVVSDDAQVQEKMLNAAVPGINGGRMMHDFGVSSSHTVIMDLPLSLDPANQMKGKPPVTYDSDKPSRFGIFPRRHPEEVRWFETDACCIFHTANSWDDLDAAGKPVAVNMLACRLTSATMVFAAGNIAPPVEKDVGATMARNKKRMPFFSKYNDASDESVWERSGSIESPDDEKEPLLRIISLEDPESPDEDEDEEEEYDVDQCRLYYYNFDLQSGLITHQWALTAIPFEFPSVHPELEMNAARYIYGCSTSATNFGSALGKATKIDVVVKIDAATLIRRGRANPPRSVSGIVDNRSMVQVLESTDATDPVRAFQMPEGWYAQEPRFIPAASRRCEDDGFLVFYAFDEEQLDEAGDVPADEAADNAKSELWIINAMDMRTIVARVLLPQRVPYGLHGTWFSAEQVREQRPVESVRSTAKALEAKGGGVWMGVRDVVEKFLG
jgi:carotenoid cleavage dioxygenase-like enzyme